MKKIFYSMFVLAMAAMTLTSCEDVPAPYGWPTQTTDDGDNTGGDEEYIPVGAGTLENPYTVADAIALTSAQDADVKSDYVYITGIVTTINEIDTGQYGNATYYIADNEGGDEYYIFRGYYLENAKFTSESQLKIGDKVIIYGQMQNYRGNTPEFAQYNYLVSINGSGGGGGGTTETIGTKDAPINVAKALELINALADGGTTDGEAYVSGKIKQIKTTDENIVKYKNIDYVITDGTNELTVFRGKNLDNTDFTAAGQISVGDEVVVLGKLTKFVNSSGVVTPEVAQGNYIVKLTKGGGDTPSTDDAKTVTIAEFNAAAESTTVWYQLTGTVKNLKDTDQYGNFDLEDSTGSVYVYGLLSTKGGEKKQFQTLAAEKGIKEGSKITIIGNRGSYSGKIEVLNAYFVSIDNSGSGSGSGSGATSLTVDFKANGQGDWNIFDTKALAEGISYVWAYDSKYGMKASAFVNSTRYETDSWLVGPALNLQNGGTLTLKHVQRYGSGSDLHVMVSTSYTSGNINAGDWTEVSLDKWPDGSNWTFIESTAKIPAGANVHIAFRYTSTSSTAATWEIESLSVK